MMRRKNHCLFQGTPESGFTEEKLSGISASNRVQLQWKDGVAYVIWCDNATLRARYQKNGIWTDMSTQICSDAYVFDTVVIKNVLYVGNSSLTSGVTLRKMKTVEGIPEIPSPPVTVPGSNEVVLNCRQDMMQVQRFILMVWHIHLLRGTRIRLPD